MPKLQLRFGDSTGRIQYFYASDLSTAGQFSIVVPDGLANGSESCGGLGQFDDTGRSWSSLCPDPAAAGFTVSGATLDTAPPVLTGVSTATPSVSPGQTMTFRYASADGESLTEIDLALVDRFGVHPLQFQDSYPTTGSVSATVPSGYANGSFTLSSVRLLDVDGNWATFFADGHSLVGPGGTPGPPSSVDFAPATLTVTGSAVDTTAPALSSLSIGQPAVVAGAPLSIAYAASDDTGLTSVSVALAGLDGTRASATTAPVTASAPTVPSSGTVTLDTTGLPSGQYRVTSVTLVDTRGANATYHDDGTITNGPWDGPATHALNFAHDLVVVSPLLAPIISGVVAPGKAVISWVTNPSDVPVSGFRLTISPGGRVLSYPATTRSVSLTLPNNVAATVTVQAVAGMQGSPAATIQVEPRIRTLIGGSGDWNGDHTNDIVAFNPATHALVLYRGNGHGGFLSGSMAVQTWSSDLRSLFRDSPQVGQLPRTWTTAYPDVMGECARYAQPVCSAYATGFGRFRTTFAADFTTANPPDILGIDDGGGLWIYPGTNSGPLYATSKRINSGWGSMTTDFDWADQTGDGHDDLVAIRNDGAMFLYPTNGAGAFVGGGTQINAGWNIYRQVFSPGDFTGDGRPDVIAVDGSGRMFLYAGTGAGRLGSRVQIGNGWQVYF